MHHEQEPSREDGAGVKSSRSVHASARPLATQLRLLLGLLVAASLLSAGAISYRTAATPARAPRLKRTVNASALAVESENSSSSSHNVELIARIPPIIHQSWKSRDAIPKRFAPWMQSWTTHHPTWMYVFWTDADNLALFEMLYPQYAHVARSVGKIGLADMARYALLHRVGGVYADADFECVRPLDALIQSHDLFLSSEPRAHTVLLEHSTSVSLCNALLASAPGHPFWLALLDAIAAKFARASDRDPVSLTGPRVLNETFFQYFATARRPSATLLPSQAFYPEVAYWNLASLERACRSRHDSAARDACEWLERFPHGEFTNETFATHHWQCTWCNGDGTSEYVALASVFADAQTRPQRPVITSSGVSFAALVS